eukprot:jgi/Bigna1/66654/fgenesh1_pg.2_\
MGKRKAIRSSSSNNLIASSSRISSRSSSALIGAIQIRPTPGDVTRNISRHLELIKLAVKHGCGVVMFPELSLTGYEPKLANDLAFSGPKDPGLDVFIDLSRTLKVVVIVGAPIRCSTGAGVQIGAFLYHPDGSCEIYCKQHLHDDELPYFVSGNEQVILDCGSGERAALAICYESLLEHHSKYAYERGARLYLASVAKPQRGVNRAFEHYPEISCRFKMPVVMSNSIGVCDDFVSAGCSAAWGASGELLGSMDDQSEGVIVLDTSSMTARIFCIDDEINGMRE